MNRRPVFLFVAALLFSLQAAATGFPILHYGVEDGLPSNLVYSIYRDSKGFLWFATDKGIARYNGIKFEIFTTYNGLPDNEVFFFKEDMLGRLWLGTFNGDLCYYKDDTFHTAANTPFLSLPARYSYIQRVRIQKDSSVDILFYDRNKLANISHDTCRIIDLEWLNTLRGSNGSDLLVREKIDHNKYRLYYTYENIVIDLAGHILQREATDTAKPNWHSLKNMRQSDCQNQEYFSNGSYIFNEKKGLIKHYDNHYLEKYFVYQIYVNATDTFIATDHGLLINSNRQILGDKKISYITQDMLGNYWVSSLGNGVFVFSKDFATAQYDNDVYAGKIQYMSGAKDCSLFTTSTNDIYRIQSEKVEHVLNYDSYVPINKAYSQSSGIVIDSTNAFYAIYNNICLIAKNLLSPHPAVTKYACNISKAYTIREVFESDSALIINARATVFTATPHGMRDKLLNCGILPGAEMFDRIFHMTYAPDKSIWYTTINNMYRIHNGAAELQTRFSGANLKSFVFFANHLVGYTHNNCLKIYSGLSDDLTIDSIPSQSCIWENFYPLDSFHLLISTNNSDRLLTFSPNGAYDLRIIENPYIPLGAESISSDGIRCSFFKDGSLTILDIRDICRRSQPPLLFLQPLKADGKIYPIGDNIVIPFKRSKNIIVSFSTLSFDSRHVSYQCSTSQKDDSDVWADVAANAVNLYDLGYGNHVIKLRAKTTVSDYCAPVVCSLYIMRPFWETWWFVSLCTLSFLALSGLAVRMRIEYVVRKNKKSHESEVKFVKAEFKVHNALMNPHFIFNTLNNVQSLINKNDKRGANEYLRVFADLIRQNMQNVSKDVIPLQKEIDLANNYLLLEKLRFEDRLSYTIKVADNVDTEEIIVPPLLIQPLVENSIKHGIFSKTNNVGIINVDVYKRDATLIIQVTDNGTGINTMQQSLGTPQESLGLENIRQRLQQLAVIQGRDITLDITNVSGNDRIVTGTKVTVQIAIQE